MSNNLLDQVNTKQKERYGIIDYVNKKHIIFYDLTHDNTLAIRLMVVEWRSSNTRLRFSVYCTTMYPYANLLPTPVMLPRNSITNIDELDLSPTELNSHQKKFSTR